MNTKSCILFKIESAKQIISDLVDMGCRFSIGDFGVGFSSFGHLKKLPVEYLKIDGDFIANMAADTVDQAMVQSMIKIARTLNIKVVAEHVQDQKTLNLLKQFGADFVQGFYLGKPEPVLGQERFQNSVDMLSAVDKES